MVFVIGYPDQNILIPFKNCAFHHLGRYFNAIVALPVNIFNDLSAKHTDVNIKYLVVNDNRNLFFLIHGNMVQVDSPCKIN